MVAARTTTWAAQEGCARFGNYAESPSPRFASVAAEHSLWVLSASLLAGNWPWRSPGPARADSPHADSDRQLLDLQRDALVAAGVDERRLIEDRVSGRRGDRAGLAKALAFIKQRNSKRMY
jgi:hypothetical protein